MRKYLYVEMLRTLTFGLVASLIFNTVCRAILQLPIIPTINEVIAWIIGALVGTMTVVILYRNTLYESSRRKS